MYDSFWIVLTEGFVGEILARRLPGVRIDTNSIAALLHDLEVVTFSSFTRRLSLIAGALAASLIGVDMLAQSKLTAAKFYQLERKVLTLFILGSNFLDVQDPKSELVTYSAAPGICSNRFAQFNS